MQKSTLLTRAYLAQGAGNVKQVSKNKQPKKGKKTKIIAVAPKFLGWGRLNSKFCIKNFLFYWFYWGVLGGTGVFPTNLTGFAFFGICLL